MVVQDGAPADVRLVVAADVAWVERAPAWAASTARAAVVVMSWPELTVVEHHAVETPASFPYIPGLLSFREIPPLSAALELVGSQPDLLLVDGHGVAHPRRFGIASHLGLMVGIPTIGCAKSRLCGEVEDPGAGRGSISEVRDGAEEIGLAVRTKTGANPLYVSTGHLIGLAEASTWVLRLAPTHRLPEPARIADQLSKGRQIN